MIIEKKMNSFSRQDKAISKRNHKWNNWKIFAVNRLGVFARTSNIASELASKDTPQSSNYENVNTNICTEPQNTFLKNNLKSTMNHYHYWLFFWFLEIFTHSMIKLSSWVSWLHWLKYLYTPCHFVGISIFLLLRDVNEWIIEKC